MCEDYENSARTSYGFLARFESFRGVKKGDFPGPIPRWAGASQAVRRRKWANGGGNGSYAAHSGIADADNFLRWLGI
jgi:hypothetical protein